MGLFEYLEKHINNEGLEFFRKDFHYMAKLEKSAKSGSYTYSQTDEYDENNEQYIIKNAYYSPNEGIVDGIYSLDRHITNIIGRKVDVLKKNIEKEVKELFGKRNETSVYFQALLDKLNIQYLKLQNLIWSKYPSISEEIINFIIYLKANYGFHITKFPDNLHPSIEAIFHIKNNINNPLRIENTPSNRASLSKIYEFKLSGVNFIIEPTFKEKFVEAFLNPRKDKNLKIKFGCQVKQAAYIFYKMGLHFGFIYQDIFNKRLFVITDSKNNQKKKSDFESPISKFNSGDAPKPKEKAKIDSLFDSLQL